MEKTIINMLKRRPLYQAEIDYMIQKAKTERQAALENDCPELKVVSKALAETIKQRDNLQRAFEEGLVTEANAEHVNTQLEQSRKQIARLTDQQVQLRAKVDRNSQEIDIEGIISSLRDFSDCLKRAVNDPELKRDFIKSRVWEIRLINRIKFEVILNGGQLENELEMKLEGEVPTGR